MEKLNDTSSSKRKVQMPKLLRRLGFEPCRIGAFIEPLEPALCENNYPARKHSFQLLIDSVESSQKTGGKKGCSWYRLWRHILTDVD